MMKINFYGNTNGVTGYATHSRELVKALKKQGVEMYSEDDINSPCLAITLPDYWRVRSGNRHTPFIPFLVFEGDKLPNSWVAACNEDYISEILVPSKYVKGIAETSGVKKMITVAPHGIDPTIFKVNGEKHNNVGGDKFKFFMLGGWGQGAIDRKGFQYGIKAFSEEFSKDDNVEMYIKINMTYNPNLNIKEEFDKLDLPDDRPAIHILMQELPYEELPQLYRSMDCFVAPSMAEAFNIPALESMACGVPVISTNYGGMTDYVNERNGWLIDVEKMIPSPGVPTHIYENTNWAVPSVTHLRKIMRGVYQNRDICTKKGTLAAKKALEYTWDNTAKVVTERFKKYEVLKE